MVRFSKSNCFELVRGLWGKGLGNDHWIGESIPYPIAGSVMRHDPPRWVHRSMPLLAQTTCTWRLPRLSNPLEMVISPRFRALDFGASSQAAWPLGLSNTNICPNIPVACLSQGCVEADYLSFIVGLAASALELSALRSTMSFSTEARSLSNSVGSGTATVAAAGLS